MQLSQLLLSLLVSGLSVGSPLPAASSSASTGCTTYTMLFARGTGDPNLSTSAANMGTVVGPGLQTAVQKALGTSEITVQGVDYAADGGGIAAELSGTGPGSQAMSAQAIAALASCPSTLIILGGYSQGGEVVHNTCTLMKTQVSSVAAVVTFGDPFKSLKLTGVDSTKWRSFCGAGDGVCGTGTCAATSCDSTSTSGHLGYGSDVTTAATFIASVVGGTSAGNASSGSSSTGTAASGEASSVAASPFTLPTGFSFLSSSLRA